MGFSGPEDPRSVGSVFEKYPLAFWFTAFITMPMAILLAVGAITAMCGLLFLWVLS